MKKQTSITTGQLYAFLGDLPKDSQFVLDIPDNIKKIESVKYVHFRKTLLPDGTVKSELTLGFLDPQKNVEANIEEDLPF